MNATTEAPDLNSLRIPHPPTRDADDEQHAIVPRLAADAVLRDLFISTILISPGAMT